MNRFNGSRVPDFNGPAPGNGTPRFHDSGDTSTAPILLGISGGLMVISIALLFARLWSRLRPYVRLDWDDWTVLAATVLAVVNYIITSIAAVYGLGRHTRFIGFAKRRSALELIFINQVIWYWSITLVKLSVATLLLRVKRESRRWRIFLYTMMGLLVAALLVQTTFQFTQCRPFSIFWDPRVFRIVKCIPRSVINGNIIAFSGFQIATDLLFSFIPITFIRKLHRPRREKIFLAILMGLGLFASFAAIMRTLQLQTFYTTTDPFRSNVTVVLWAMVEQQFALIAATMPTLKSFLEKTLIKIGLFFYDENTETQVRSRLVQFGLLDNDTKTTKVVTSEVASAGSPKLDRKLRDEFGDTIVSVGNDKDVEMMLERDVI
ncbi:hypothetical protein BDV96DRAFT_590879 [Lophiotrema nucula]|uniref:Rhodopsin domain-containing protein n=1 Tax=Lophiotrema nucula TaxID=690887 RepID=A0A6A5YH77_9PLEO|nr:hypothetical protein BDV96DRAFT_590879 [Lophiotrema nucula]